MKSYNNPCETGSFNKKPCRNFISRIILRLLILIKKAVGTNALAKFQLSEKAKQNISIFQERRKENNNTNQDDDDDDDHGVEHVDMT